MDKPKNDKFEQVGVFRKPVPRQISESSFATTSGVKSVAEQIAEIDAEEAEKAVAIVRMNLEEAWRSYVDDLDPEDLEYTDTFGNKHEEPDADGFHDWLHYYGWAEASDDNWFVVHTEDGGTRIEFVDTVVRLVVRDEILKLVAIGALEDVGGGKYTMTEWGETATKEEIVEKARSMNIRLRREES